MGQQQGQVKRFEFFATDAYAAEKGQYVLYTDYATLQAKNAKLVEACELALKGIGHLREAGYIAIPKGMLTEENALEAALALAKEG